VLGGEGTRWVLDRVRARLERGQELVGPISLGEATPEQRRAIETLFGRPARLGRSVTVSLSELDTLVRRSGLHADGLAAAVVALTGPISTALGAQATLIAAGVLGAGVTLAALMLPGMRAPEGRGAEVPRQARRAPGIARS